MASMEEASGLVSFIAGSTGKSGRTEDIKPIQIYRGLKLLQLLAYTDNVVDEQTFM